MYGLFVNRAPVRTGSLEMGQTRRSSRVLPGSLQLIQRLVPIHKNWKRDGSGLALDTSMQRARTISHEKVRVSTGLLQFGFSSNLAMPSAFEICRLSDSRTVPGFHRATVYAAVAYVHVISSHCYFASIRTAHCL
jgi:hypothetical protein